jgi:hypothetical protein
VSPSWNGCSCTDDDERHAATSTPVPIVHVLRTMDEKRSVVDKLGGLEGADAAALGLDATPEPAPPGAEILDDEQLVPGAHADDVPRTEAKPWFTSLAAGSDQAGVANDPPDAREPDLRPEDETGS